MILQDFHVKTSTFRNQPNPSWYIIHRNIKILLFNITDIKSLILNNYIISQQNTIIISALGYIYVEREKGHEIISSLMHE